MSKENIFVTKPTLPPLEEIWPEFKSAWKLGRVTNKGPQYIKLKQELGKKLGNKNFALFNNGTIALLIGLRALKLKGEVLVSPFTFPATISAIEWTGLTPVFCDIDPKTMCIDPKKIKEAVTYKTSAILGIHVYGIPCDVNTIQEIADKHNLKVVYDAAHAFMSEVNGKPISQFGDVSMFSFHATKIYNTIEGGGLAFKDSKVMERAELMSNFGIAGQEEVILSGVNGKMNELQAIVGLANLKSIDQERENRKKVQSAYDSLLESSASVLTFSKLTTSYQYYPIRIKSGLRNKVYETLKDNGYFARKYFYPLSSNYDFYKSYPSAIKSSLPEANNAAEEILCLPFYGDLGVRDVDAICKCILNGVG